MSLSSMIIPSKTAWIEYPGCPGFELQLAYLTKDELMKIRTKSMTSKVNRKTRQMEEDVDSDMFQTYYTDAVLKDWRGFKYKYLNEFTIWDEAQVDDAEAEIDFDIEDAIELTKASPAFDNWV